ncbi:hypothetical protein EDD22DRAFT_786776, partial [Suillus occidentalis]
AFLELSDVEFELLKVPATACIVICGASYGNTAFAIIAGQWKEAADRFSCGTRSIFASLTRNPVSSSKCFRKAALAHLKRKDCTHAGSIICRHHDAEATTRYVIFLIAVHQSSRAHHLIA